MRSNGGRRGGAVRMTAHRMEQRMLDQRQQETKIHVSFFGGYLVSGEDRKTGEDDRKGHIFICWKGKKFAKQKMKLLTWSL